MSVALQLERDRAYQGILNLILGGSVEASGPFSERKLAAALEIGRMPVREALSELARDGVLEVRPARGTFVRAPSAQDVREIYEVRHGLEGLAAFLAAERGATPALQAFGPRFRTMIERGADFAPAQIYDTGAEFHTEMFRAARNRQLLEIYQPIRLRFALALRLPRLYDHARVHESAKEHLAILDAIAAGDGREAQRLVIEHLSRGSEVRSRIFAELADSPLAGLGGAPA